MMTNKKAANMLIDENTRMDKTITVNQVINLPEKKYLSQIELQNWLGVGKDTISEWIDDGLRSIKTSRSVKAKRLFKISDVEKYLEKLANITSKLGH